MDSTGVSETEKDISTPLVLSDDSGNITKYSIRETIWRHLERNNLVNFPRPCWARIPNFKGCKLANEKLIQLDVFKNANVVKVNPDKPQQPVRESVLENRKTLLVPIPRLREGLLRLVVLEQGSTHNDIKQASTKEGIIQYGKPIDLNAKIKIDLVVMGSVAVSKEGYRIGKGEGYADLEFAMMMHMNAVNQDTIVVTTVHDNQVFDTLPEELFKPHDVPVDIIVTPTQVIHVNKRLPKPSGIIWSILSQRRLNLMPILQILHKTEQENGKDVTLKEEDSDTETQKRYTPRYRRNRVSRFRKRSDNRKNSELEDEEAAYNDENRPQRRPPRRHSYRRRNNMMKNSTQPSENGVENRSDNITNKKNERRIRKNYRKRHAIDFSLRVGNIDRTVRVRDLKAALAERGVKPNEITWRGHKGFCVLHFVKSSRNIQNTSLNTSGNDNSIGVDNIIDSLQDLKLSSNADKSLTVEPAKPISRIETTDVTAV